VKDIRSFSLVKSDNGDGNQSLGGANDSGGAAGGSAVGHGG